MFIGKSRIEALVPNHQSVDFSLSIPGEDRSWGVGGRNPMIFFLFSFNSSMSRDCWLHLGFLVNHFWLAPFYMINTALLLLELFLYRPRKQISKFYWYSNYLTFRHYCFGEVARWQIDLHAGESGDEMRCKFFPHSLMVLNQCPEINVSDVNIDRTCPNCDCIMINRGWDRER